MRNRLLVALLATLALGPISAAAKPPAAGMELHITWSPKVDTIDFYCPIEDQLCLGTFSAVVQSNLSRSAGLGIDSITVMAVNGSLDPCNRAIDQFVFSFPEGNLFVSSDHVDCPAWIRPFPPGDGPGPRVDAVFQITGGTGAFAGATGGGSERGYGGGRQGAIVFNGTIGLP